MSNLLTENIDLQLASELQKALLPHECPQGCEHQQAAALNRMCSSVGGDFYDFIRLNDDQYAVLIGDVMGHGVTAALIMSKIMGFLRSNLIERSRPTPTIIDLNRTLIELGDRINSVVSCSMIYGVIDEPSGTGFFINAGHPAPYLCDKNTCQSMHLGSKNYMLGIEEFEPVDCCHEFTPGQRLVLYTDGLTDAMNPHGDMFNSKRLFETITNHSSDPPADCARAVFDEIDAFTQNTTPTDDQTIVVIDRI